MPLSVLQPLPGGFPKWFATLGPGIQTLFAQASFNQNALYRNISWRQVQQYQKKNYNIAWIAIARRDILSMMSVSVNRINNYIIVGTLILGVGTGTIWSARFYPHSDFTIDSRIVVAFYGNVAISTVYLLLSIVLGVRGQNKAFTYTLKLLTFHIRPENPAEYNHDYMKQIQWIERCGLPALFRIPGLMPPREHMRHREEHEDLLRGKFVGSADHAESQTDNHQKGNRIEDFTALENMDVKTTHTWYLSRYADFMQLWLWYEKYARLAMGLGIISLVQGGVYYLTWRLKHVKGETHILGRILPSGVIMVVLISTLWVILKSNVKLLADISSTQVLWIGSMVLAPMVGTVASACSTLQTHGSVEDAFSIGCFIFHLIFWVVALVLHESDAKINAERRFVLGNFWSEDTDHLAINVDLEREREGRKHHDNALAGSHGQTEVEVEEEDPDLTGATAMTGNSLKENWPTASREFNQKVLSAREGIRSTIRKMLIVTILFWLLIIVASVEAVIEFHLRSASSDSRDSIPFALTQESIGESIEAFAPDVHAVSCSSSKVFVADVRSIYELAKGILAPIVCNLTSTAGIVDIASSCDEITGQCSVIVLQTVAVNTSHITDCQTGRSARLLQESGPAEQIGLHHVDQGGDLYKQRLVAAQGGKLLQYKWSQTRAGWEPEWPLGSISEDGRMAHVSSIAIVDSSLFLFFAAWDQGKAVERRDLNAVQTDSAWRVLPPSMPSYGGCAIDSQHVITLSHDNSPRLTRLYVE